MKKMLSLDGGGIRGIFAIAILEKMEALLRERYAPSRSGFVLADYFDFIGGTSTGAIIAAMLSKGMSVRAIRESYEQLGPIVFRRKPFWKSWRSFFCSHAFADLLKEIFEESPGVPMTLGSEKLRTDLLLIMRNGSTGSIWPLTNNPNAKYNQRTHSDDSSNLDLPLWQLVRASAAAPVFFPSELITLNRGDGQAQHFEFIDGGVSPYNNPSIAMYLNATLPEYRMNYPTGKGELYLCSVGTGRIPLKFEPGQLGQINVIGGALRTLSAVMGTVGEEQDKLCRVLGDCIHGGELDREIGDLKGSGMGQFQYVRYDHEFTSEEIAVSRARTKSLRPLDIDDIAGFDDLLKIGREVAEVEVSDSHLP